ncbi:MAG: hypothetical protein ACE5JB_04370 [bacterium]
MHQTNKEPERDFPDELTTTLFKAANFTELVKQYAVNEDPLIYDVLIVIGDTLSEAYSILEDWQDCGYDGGKRI